MFLQFCNYSSVLYTVQYVVVLCARYCNVRYIVVDPALKLLSGCGGEESRREMFPNELGGCFQNLKRVVH